MIKREGAGNTCANSECRRINFVQYARFLDGRVVCQRSCFDVVRKKEVEREDARVSRSFFRN